MIPNLAVSLLAVAAFAVALWRVRIVTVARDALGATVAGLGAMTNSELDDDAKEIAVRRAGFGLLLAAFNIFWRFGLALAATAVPVLLADLVGLAPLDGVLALMLRWDFILAVSIIAIVLAGFVRRRRAPDVGTGATINRYSPAERSLHMLAFSSPAVLKAASSVEDRLLLRAARDPSAPPIFVTSLARGGTTALLNAFHGIPEVATHTYRDMPFLTAPTLWNRLAGGHKRGAERQQRAHGDGLEIDLDTPEAFEEVIWKMFWPEKYCESSIELWREADRKAEADHFLNHHMMKVIHARSSQEPDDAPEKTVYCSKNNANIARIPYLAETFPGCRIVVPVRRPESHAASLLRQHRNFLKLQAEDDFVRRYMSDIGHFEFGLIHKPLRFPGLDMETHDATEADYWLHYWIESFREVLRHRERCIFVLQDELRAAPQETMTRLCEALGLAPGSTRFAGYFRSGPDRSATDLFDSDLYGEAVEIFRELEGARSAGLMRQEPARAET